MPQAVTFLHGQAYPWGVPDGGQTFGVGVALFAYAELSPDAA
jgi:hypothetical protein